MWWICVFCGWCSPTPPPPCVGTKEWWSTRYFLLKLANTHDSRYWQSKSREKWRCDTRNRERINYLFFDDDRTMYLIPDQKSRQWIKSALVMACYVNICKICAQCLYESCTPSLFVCQKHYKNGAIQNTFSFLSLNRPAVCPFVAETRVL
jgi:hypothetical protein